MGCQGSKTVAVNAAPQTSSTSLPSKTLLTSHRYSMTSSCKKELPSDAHGAANYFRSSLSESMLLSEVHIGRVRRHPTLCTARHEVDVMISQFTSHDSTVGNAIGRNCKDVQWKVMYDLDKEPIAVSLHVQEHKLHYNEVRIECNGTPIFQGASSQTKGRMTEDFYYEWPLCGTIRGINETNYFEVRAFGYSGAWFPATITGQSDDGFFEVVAQQPDGRGFLKNVTYPAVDKADLREAGSGGPLVVPESSLILHVPMHDPLKAVFSVNGEAVTHHFGRPSPAASSQMKETPKIQLQVSQDRSRVRSNVGHHTVSQFVSGEVSCVKSETERLMRSWTVQCGPFAQHSVKIVKNYTLGKIVTLLVDGEVFVESSASDMGCQDHAWRCDFRFVGEKILDFEVYKTNNDGVALDETDHVEEKRKYTHMCSVIVPNAHDFRSARFVIDNQDFRELPVTPASFHHELGLFMEPLAMLHTYGITVPYKVDITAPCGIAHLSNRLLARVPSLEDSKIVASGLFPWFCNSGSTSTAQVVEIIPSQDEIHALRMVDSKLSPTETYI